MSARLSAFVIWALVAASAVFWSLRLVVRAPGAPAHTVAVGDTAPLRADLTRLFGAPPVAAGPSVQVAAASSRFTLAGVMAPKLPGGPGIALIGVDGKTPRAFRTGSTVDGNQVLQSVSLRSASIGPVGGGPSVVLEVPPLAMAATGTLPPPAPMTPPTSGPVPPVSVPPTPVAPVSPIAVPAMPGRSPQMPPQQAASPQFQPAPPQQQPYQPAQPQQQPVQPQPSRFGPGARDQRQPTAIE
jgi:general secretion pathway protein C